MSISVGDAVLNFLGDSTQLDTKFAEVGPNAKAAFEPAAEAVENATERMTFSMREAKGEARLLGEAIGVHLPRHVSSFLAELPGVGPALSAAFSATAVLFLAQALVEVTKKASAFVADTFIFTESMKENNATIEAENKSLVALSDIYNKAKEELDKLTGSTKSQEDAARAMAQAQVDQAKAELAAMEATIAHKSGWDKAKDTMKDVAGTILSTVIPGYFRLSSATQDQIALQEKQEAVTTITAKALRATSEVNAEEAAKKAKLAIDNSLRELENQKKIALAYAQNDQEKFELEQSFEEKKLQLLKSYAVKDVAQIKALMAEIEAQQIIHSDKISAAFVKLLQTVQQAKVESLNAVKSSTLANIIELTPLLAAFDKAEQAAHSMGVTLRTDLVGALERAKQAEKDFLAGGIVDPVAFKAMQKNIADAQKALDNFGKAEDTFKLKSHGLWAEFRNEAKTGATAMDLVKQSGVTAFDDLSKNIEGAFSAIVMGQGNVVQALEKATAASLAQIASQAAVKSLFYAAEGTASLWTNPPAANGYFLAAGEMAAVAVLAGAAGHFLAGAAGGGGGGSSSGSTAQLHTSQSNTGSQPGGGRSVVGVQAMALGGLITAPTLIMAGEAGREAVIPLDNPSAQQQMRGSGVGGGTHFHINVEGMISPDNLGKVVEQINKRVNRGQLSLLSSNTLRVTKRSA